MFWQLVRAKRQALEAQAEAEAAAYNQQRMTREDFEACWLRRDALAAKYEAKKNSERDEALKKKDADIA
eukprot:969487-Alexandrium_andersonii.AAC.1